MLRVKKGGKIKQSAPGGKKKVKRPSVEAPGLKLTDGPGSESEGFDDLPDDIRQFGDMTLREVVRRFGTEGRFLDWLNAMKRVEDLHEKRVKNEIVENTLVPRAYVSNHIFSLIEILNIRLLTDAPRTLAVRMIELVNAGETAEAVEDCARLVISSQLKGIKDKVTGALKNA